jgi:putative endonuclease
MPYFVYVLTCADGTLYTGSTTDLTRRLTEHNATAHGARYTKSRRPVQLAYSEIWQSRSDALKREAAIKKLTRLQKEALISSAKSH